MRSAYHDDAYDDHGPYKGGPDGLVKWVEEMHVHVEQSMHFLGNCFIEFFGNFAAVETYATAYQRFVPQGEQNRRMYDKTENIPDGYRLRIMAAVRYVDRFERRAGSWRIAHRICVMETVWTQVIKADVSSAPGWVLTQRDQTDALWAMRSALAGTRSASSHDMRDISRPAEVNL
jgi:hypothetical protein